MDETLESTAPPAVAVEVTLSGRGTEDIQARDDARTARISFFIFFFVIPSHLPGNTLFFCKKGSWKQLSFLHPFLPTEQGKELPNRPACATLDETVPPIVKGV